jgi:hypothetical protein
LLVLCLALPAPLSAQFTYTTNNGTITVTGYAGPGGEVVIPETVGGLPVVRIGRYAFYNNTALTGITIPNGILIIGGMAFTGTSLVSVTLPNSVVEIGDGAFAYCWSLASVVMSDSVTWIDSGAFSDCSNLTSVTFPPSLRVIGGGVFAGCYNLTALLFGGNAPSFGHDAFGYPPVRATVYYLPGTTGWTPTVEGVPTAPWVLPEPLILTLPPDFGVGANGYGFVISWATNASVVVEACTDLALPDWSPVGTNPLVQGWSYFSDPEWTNCASRFYRLRSP